jgi:hypothetical protein
MNIALEYSTRVVQEGDRRCKKSTLNDLVHLTPLRIPLMNPPFLSLYANDGVTHESCWHTGNITPSPPPLQGQGTTDKVISG